MAWISAELPIQVWSGIEMHCRVQKYISAFDKTFMILLTLQHTALQGDPALRLNTHSLPDYVIEEPYVFFEPSVITTLEDSFTVQVVVTNIGMAIDKDYSIS